METANVTISVSDARALYRKYKAHVHHQKPIDREVMRAYQLLAQGRLVIKALASIVNAGLDINGHPRLAIAPADATEVVCRQTQGGACVMDSRLRQNMRWRDGRGKLISDRAYVSWPEGTFKNVPKSVWNAQAQVPTVPPDLKPKRGLQNYHILFEAVWTKAPPLDPYLLRRIGKADLWVVVGMWELTEVERAALSTRM